MAEKREKGIYNIRLLLCKTFTYHTVNELVFNVTWLYPENIQEYTICEDFTALQLPTKLSCYNSSS